jgi:hypothetical protein
MMEHISLRFCYFSLWTKGIPSADRAGSDDQVFAIKSDCQNFLRVNARSFNRKSILEISSEGEAEGGASARAQTQSASWRFSMPGLKFGPESEMVSV